MEQTPFPGVDREVFERVWRRVMPEDRADCPFTLPEAEAPAAAALTAGEMETLTALLEKVSAALEQAQTGERE